MKKTTLVLAFIAAFCAVQAQNFLEKIPANATVVIKVDAGQMSNLLPNKKFNEYSYVQKFLKQFALSDGKFDIAQVGVDLTKIVYGYYAPLDTNFAFVLMLPMKDVSAFTKQIMEKNPDAVAPVKKNGYTMQKISDQIFMAYDDTKLAIITSVYSSYGPGYFNEPYPSRYEDLDGLGATEQTATVAVDAAVAAPVADAVSDVVVMDQVAEAAETVKPKKPKPKKPLTAAQKAAEAKRKKEEAARKKKEKEEEDRKERAYQAKLDAYEKRSEAFYEAKRKANAEAQEKIAGKVAANFFSNAQEAKLITSNTHYAKLIDASAPVSAWYNATGFLSQYSRMFGNVMGLGDRYSLMNEVATEAYRAEGMAANNKDFFSATNVYFEAKAIRAESKGYSTDKSLNEKMQAVFNSKQSDKLMQLVNPGALAVMSNSINNEAMINYYYSFFKDQMYQDNLFGARYRDEAEIVIDAIEIALDEKGIASLMPGNSMLVLHDITPKKVKYTTYEYDNDFNKKEVTKEKTELAPDFTIALETQKEEFVNKLMRLPLKYSTNDNPKYVDNKNYFEIVFKEGELPIDRLYLLTKNGQVILTTSKTVVDNVLTGKGFTANAATVDAIKNNNVLLTVDAKKIIEKVGAEMSTQNTKKIVDYLRDNMGEISINSKIKDGMLQNTTLLGINGTHNNSLEYIFELIEKLNELMDNSSETVEEIKVKEN